LVEWIFAFETRRIVSRSKIDNVVDDIFKLLEYAKGFPREHLMSAGQLLLIAISQADPLSVPIVVHEAIASGCTVKRRSTPAVRVSFTVKASRGGQCSFRRRPDPAP